MSDLIPTSALAASLGVNRRTLARWASEGKCPSPRVFNRRLYFFSDEIEAWKKSWGTAKVTKGDVCNNDQEISRIPS